VTRSPEDIAFWDQVSDDEFIEEAQRRVNQGNWSPDRYISNHQSADRAKWGIVRSAVIQAKVDSIRSGECHPALIALALACDKLDGVAGNPIEPAFAINTIMPGKDNIYQNHSPVAAE